MKMAGTAFKDPRVVELARSFVPVLVDARTHSEVFDGYGMSATPAVVLAGPDGKAVASLEGLQTADAVLDGMRTALDSAKGVR